MIKIEKDGIMMVARDKNQLAAFLNNGWQKVTEEKPEEKDDSAEEAQKDEQSDEPEPPKRGRKPAQK